METNNKSSLPLMENNPQVVKNGCNTRTKLIHSYRWTIPNFSLRPEKKNDALQSSEFSAGRNDQKWFLDIYPKGINGYQAYVPLYLYLKRRSKLPIIAKYKLSIVDVNGVEANLKKKHKIFTVGEGTGFHDFIAQNTLLNKANNLLPDDNLTILCEITIISETVQFCGQSIVKHAKYIQNETIGSLFDNPRFSDIKFAIDDKEIKAHKCILAAHSEVFAAMFEHDMEETKSNRVVITDADFEVFSEMLHYIYTGKAPKLYEVANELLIVADKYDLEMLKLMCEEAIRAKLSIETASETLKLADLHNACQLKSDTLDFISSHMGAFIENQGWSNMFDAQLIEEIVGAYVHKNNYLKEPK